jgi:glycopeptide antibiotics resistance protein
MKAYIFDTFLASVIYSIPFILVSWLIAILVSRHQRKPIRWLWLIALAGWITALVNIFVNTLSFAPFLDGFRFYGNINLTPFIGIIRMINDLLSADPSHYSFTNFFGNIGFFMPLGFFLPFLSKKLSSGWKVILLGFCISLFIEVSQLFIPARGSDIDDIILNTLGTALGFLLYWAIAKSFPRVLSRFQ